MRDAVDHRDVGAQRANRLDVDVDRRSVVLVEKCGEDIRYGFPAADRLARVEVDVFTARRPVGGERRGVVAIEGRQILAEHRSDLLDGRPAGGNVERGR